MGPTQNASMRYLPVYCCDAFVAEGANKTVEDWPVKFSALLEKLFFIHPASPTGVTKQVQLTP